MILRIKKELLSVTANILDNSLDELDRAIYEGRRGNNVVLRNDEKEALHRLSKLTKLFAHRFESGAYDHLIKNAHVEESLVEKLIRTGRP